MQPVRVDDCLDAKTNEPYQDIVCNECDLVIASGIGITTPPSLEAAVGTAYKTGWEHGKVKGRESCAKLCERYLEFKRREWVGLTEEEKYDCYLKIDVWSRCVEAVEAKLKEKNT